MFPAEIQNALNDHHVSVLVVRNRFRYRLGDIVALLQAVDIGVGQIQIRGDIETRERRSGQIPILGKARDRVGAVEVQCDLVAMEQVGDGDILIDIVPSAAGRRREAQQSCPWVPGDQCLD